MAFALVGKVAFFDPSVLLFWGLVFLFLFFDSALSKPIDGWTMRLFPAPKIGCGRDFSKHLSPERLDLEIWPLNGPCGGQKRNREVKSVSTDPSGAATELLEPSCGRFRQKPNEKQGFGTRKMEP